MRFSSLFKFFIYSSFTISPIIAQEQKSNQSTDILKPFPHPKDKLFINDDIFQFKLIGNLHNLFKDRNNSMSYHPMLIQYKETDSSIFSISLGVKTRGNFRRNAANCRIPPLLLHFTATSKIKGSVFDHQKRLKLVVPCQGDEYVVREWLVYKLYNLLTEKSFKAKLVKVEFVDSLQKEATESHYCILIEDEYKLADRNKCFVSDKKMLPMQNMDRKEFLKMSVFQYMIGNTDWSVPYLQNIKLIYTDSIKPPIAVPYDFDLAGIVEAPYAKPAPELELSSVRQRIYRGFCIKDYKEFSETFELFNQLKEDFYKTYSSCSLLSSKYVKSTTRFLNEFYKVINNNRIIDSEFGNPCRTDVRIEIKGLKKR